MYNDTTREWVDKRGAGNLLPVYEVKTRWSIEMGIWVNRTFLRSHYEIRTTPTSPFGTKRGPSYATAADIARLAPGQSHKKISTGTLVRILSLETGAWDNEGTVRCHNKNGKLYCIETSIEGSLVLRWWNRLLPIPAQGSTRRYLRVSDSKSGASSERHDPKWKTQNMKKDAHIFIDFLGVNFFSGFFDLRA